MGLAVVGVESLAVSCIIGTEAHERQKEQDIFIDVSVEVNVAQAAIEDSLEKTVNYVELASLCQQTAKRGQFFLLEKCAKDILQEILRRFPVHSAFIRIRKPGAIPKARGAYIELHLSRSEEQG